MLQPKDKYRHFQLLNLGEQILREAEIADPKNDSRLLLQMAANLDHARLISSIDSIATQSTQSRFLELIERRCEREPVHRIAGYREFYGRQFELSRATLEPRPETELLVEMVLERVGRKNDKYNVLDVGTGSGVLALTLLLELPNAIALATDISQEALNTAAINAKRHGVEESLTLKVSDMFASVEGRFDIIVSNPPYIKSSALSELQAEVRLFDPDVALDGGEDGLNYYRSILGDGKHHLSENGFAILEIGAGQAKDVCKLAKLHNWKLEQICKDLAGVERAVVLSSRV